MIIAASAACMRFHQFAKKEFQFVDVGFDSHLGTNGQNPLAKGCVVHCQEFCSEFFRRELINHDPNTM